MKLQVCPTIIWHPRHRRNLRKLLPKCDTTSSCIVVAASAKICSAMVHWTHFSQALIAAATVTAVIGTSAADMQANKKMAACHSPPFIEVGEPCGKAKSATECCNPADLLCMFECLLISPSTSGADICNRLPIESRILHWWLVLLQVLSEVPLTCRKALTLVRLNYSCSYNPGTNMVQHQRTHSSIKQKNACFALGRSDDPLQHSHSSHRHWCRRQSWRHRACDVHWVMPPPRANRRQLWPRCMTPEVSCGGGWNEVWFRWTLMELHGTAWSSLDLWSCMSFASISSDLSQSIPCPITCKPLSDLYEVILALHPWVVASNDPFNTTVTVLVNPMSSPQITRHFLRFLTWSLWMDSRCICSNKASRDLKGNQGLLLGTIPRFGS